MTAKHGRPTFPALRTAALLLLTLSVAACSGEPGFHPVKGKVLVGNTPAEGALVIFHPKGNTDPKAYRPSGLVGADGTFTLTTRTPGDGAPAGDYIVAIIWPEKANPGKGIKSMSSGESKEQPDRLQGRYASEKVSKLTAKVEPKTNELPAFQLP